jgi:hypothetical protein
MRERIFISRDEEKVQYKYAPEDAFEIYGIDKEFNCSKDGWRIYELRLKLINLGVYEKDINELVELEIGKDYEDRNME